MKHLQGFHAKGAIIAIIVFHDHEKVETNQTNMTHFQGFHAEGDHVPKRGY